MYYLFKHILGDVTLDSQYNVVEKKEITEKTKELPSDKLQPVLQHFKNQKYFKKFYEKNIQLTKQAIKESVNQSTLILQTSANSGELDRSANLLSKRLREWYALYLPEFVQKMNSHQKFAELIASKSRQELVEELHLQNAMGADLHQEDVQEMILLAKQITELYKLKEKHEVYLHKIMKQYCPNLLELAGVSIGAKLLELGKGLRHLALLPASTIQLLGAEKALFRHIKTGAKSPKHGIIIHHPLVQGAPRNIRGKVARSLADKLSLCARIDYFKGDFRADIYKKELEGKFV